MKKWVVLFILTLLSVSLSISSFAAVESYTQDFAGFDVDTELKDDAWSGWSLIRPTDKGAYVKEADGNKYLDITSYYHAEYNTQLTEPYVYEVDVFNDKANFNVSAFFVRAGKEKFDVMFGKATGFEFDGDHDIGFPSVGGSGIMVLPNSGKKLSLVVKTYDESNEYKIGNVKFEADVEADFSTGFRTLKFVDDGETVKVYANDELAFIVEMSDPGTYPVGEETYFKKVVVKGKDGNELGTVETARVSVDSVIIIGNRETQFKIDNIKIYALDDEPNTPTFDATTILPVVVSALVALVVFKKRQYA